MANCRVVVTDSSRVQGVVDAGFMVTLQPVISDEGTILIGKIFTQDQVAAVKAAPGFISMLPPNPVR